MHELAQTLIKNTKGLKVLTPTGLRSFSGMSKTWHEKIVEIKTCTRSIKSGLKHKFLCEPGWIDAEHIEPGMSLTTADGKDDIVMSVKIIKEPQWLYDLLDVEGGSAYITNGVISHNCEFISSEAMLIDSIKLAFFRPTEPSFENMGFRFWLDKDKIGGLGKTFMVGVDPATGNGSDFTTIEVVEFPSLAQVGELRLNTVNVPLIYAKIKWLLKFLRTPDANRKRAEVIWSFERNGVGEALVAMIQNDGEGDGVYIDGTELFNERPDRFGVYTTGKSKLVACMQLKNLLEKIQGGIKVHSDVLIFELKDYIARGGTYAARDGSTDDAVSALLVVMKLLERLASYDDGARRLVYESVSPELKGDEDASDAPFDAFGGEAMPFMVV